MFRSLEHGLSASQIMTSPKSDPMIPMLTTAEIGLPMRPYLSLVWTFSAKSWMQATVRLTLGITSFPSTRIGVFNGFFI